MYSSYLCFNYKCLNCNETRTRMAEEQPDDIAKCVSCVKKDDDILNPVKVVFDGAPCGFVTGGSSNKAGFSKGTVFNGDPNDLNL